MSPTAAVSAALSEGARIGVYTLRELLGRSAARSVYRAEQEGKERPVALKVLSEKPLSPTELARFRYEVQALTALRHPGIAPIYATGIHVVEDGDALHEIPWFATELLREARPLVEYAEARGLKRADRLRLFVQACDAVQHGHQKGVVHGDLQADRILVDDDGRPKVIDFGVARALAPGGDVRHDVHALGLVLQGLVGNAKGDLDAILRTALDEDVARRYASANALAADVRRYLEHRPIEARAANPIYPMRLFARRHRVIVGAIALLVILSLAAAAFGVLSAVRARQELDDLRRELDAGRGD